MEEPQRKQIESQQGLTIVTSKYAVKCKLCISYIKKSPVKFFCAATSPPFCKASGALCYPLCRNTQVPLCLAFSCLAYHTPLLFGLMEPFLLRAPVVSLCAPDTIHTPVVIFLSDPPSRLHTL